MISPSINPPISSTSGHSDQPYSRPYALGGASASLQEVSLKINAIYSSVQGESTRSGELCTFVRTTGCPLRCRWCDSAHAFYQGRNLSAAEILSQVEDLGIQLVEITGGEPLAQRGTITLCHQLIRSGYKVMMETSGSEDISEVPAEVQIIMDLKCPGSEMHDKNRYDNLAYLCASDEIKFVLASHEDFLWTQEIIKRFDLTPRHTILLSPASGLLKPKDLVSWMIKEKTPARLNLQIHKFIWHPNKANV